MPRCSGNEFLHITSAFFLWPAVTGVGWLMAEVSGVLWPTLCVGLAAGLITIREDTAAAGTKSFGLVTGVCFAGLAVVSVIVTLRKKLRGRTR